MPPSTPLDCFADLYRLLVERDDEDVFADILAPALPRLCELMRPLAAYRLRDERGGYQASDEDLWEWFALAAINDHLLVPLTISHQHYRRFFEELASHQGPSHDVRGRWTSRYSFARSESPAITPSRDDLVFAACRSGDRWQCLMQRPGPAQVPDAVEDGVRHVA